MMLQSTFAIRLRGVTFETNGRKKRTNDPPASAMSGSHSGVEDAKNATATARVTASVKTIPLRWRGAAGIETAGVRGAARSFRNANQTRAIATARHATVTGRRYAVKVRNGIPDRIPMNAFCGLPTSVATLPTFAEIATATRYGIGFTRNARTPHDDGGHEQRDRVVQDDGGQRRGRDHEPDEEGGLRLRPRRDPRRDEVEESAGVEPRHEDHHADEEQNHVQVDGGDRLRGRQDSEDEHERAAEHGDGRPFDGEPPDVPKRNQDVCDDENGGRGVEGVRGCHERCG